MKKEKLYFKDVDSTMCHPLSYHLADALADEETEITLVEAIRDTETKDYIFCSWAGDVGERSECTKKNCDMYEANKSGRGVCINRGKLYTFGDEVIIKINQNETNP